MKPRIAETSASLVTDCLAAYRLTRLVVEDEITRPVRDKVVGWLIDHDHKKIAYLFSCPFCASPYLAVLIVVAERWFPSRSLVVRRWLAVAGAVALIHDLLDSMDNGK